MKSLERPEEYFPRGGRQDVPIYKQKTFVFEKKKKIKEAKKKLGRRERMEARLTDKVENEVLEMEEEETQTRVTYVPSVTYRDLTEGMKLVCSVRSVHKNNLEVTLPGRLAATVSALNISTRYSANAKGNPFKLFNVGQCLVCKVTKTRGVTDNRGLEVTVDPAEVNSELGPGCLTRGTILSVAVNSVEDHGYTLATGIAGTVAFLPIDSATLYQQSFNNGRPLEVGQVAWGLVDRYNESTKAITFSVDPERVSQALLSENITSETLRPATTLHVLIAKILEDGLLVRVPNTGMKGYVEAAHLKSDWSKPGDHQVGSSLQVTVLYKLPLVDVFYFSAKLDKTQLRPQRIKLGTIFPSAQVESVVHRGIYVKLEEAGESYKGIISRHKINAEMERDEMAYMLGTAVSCRVLSYDSLENVYICTMEKHILEEKFVSIDDLSLGQEVNFEITKYLNNGDALVRLGMLTGILPSNQVSDLPSAKPAKLNVGAKYKGRVFELNEARGTIVVTLKPSLVSSTPLVSFDNLTRGDSYYGTVVKNNNTRLSVQFFGRLTAKIPKQFLLNDIQDYAVGQLVKCYVSNEFKQQFSLKKGSEVDLKGCTEYTVQITQVSDNGLTGELEGQEILIPWYHLNDHLALSKTLLKQYTPGCRVVGAIFLHMQQNKPIFTLRDSIAKFFKKQDVKCFEDLRAGMEVPCIVVSVKQAAVGVRLPFPFNNAFVKIKQEDLFDDFQKQFEHHQTVLVKVKAKKGSKLTLTCKQSEIKVKSKWAVGNLLKYLIETCSVQEVKPGARVKAKVTALSRSCAEVELIPGGQAGTVVNSKAQSLKMGQTIDATVLFQDARKPRTVYLHMGKHPRINSKQTVNPSKMESKRLECIVLSVNSYFIVGVLTEGANAGQLVFVPTYLHPNATTPLFPRGFTGVNKTHQFVLKSMESNFLIGTLEGGKIEDGLVKIEEEEEEEDEIKPEENSEDEEMAEDAGGVDSEEESQEGGESSEEEGDGGEPQVKQESDSEQEVLSEEEEEAVAKVLNGKRKKDKSDKETKKGKKKRRVLEENIDPESSEEEEETKGRSGGAEDEGLAKAKREIEKELALRREAAARFMWEATPQDLARLIAEGDSPAQQQVEQESDEDEEVEVRRKLTPAERRTMAEEMEREIRQKEEELLECEKAPKSADHFDRLLLAEPNNSKLWVQYMAFHLQATEIEKARVVAKRALKNINIREEQERLNVWIALLNLENLYGTPEEFKETLGNALKFNDDYSIYRGTLDLYVATRRPYDGVQWCDKMVRNFRGRCDVWLDCFEALMKLDQHDKARQFLQRALQALPKKHHVALLTKFAVLENKAQNTEEAQALFETIVTSYPARVDIWSAYVDMLVKSRLIDVARQVLRRAVSHSLPARKMKVLYAKWLVFEEQHGDEDSVREVKEGARQFVNRLTSKPDQDESNL